MTTLGKLVANCVVVLIGGLSALTLLRPPSPPAEEKKELHRRADWDLTLDLELLERVKLSDATSRLAYLRKYSASDEDLLGVERLIRQLGSRNFKERQSAEDRLIHLNLVGLPLLRKAKSDKDPEIATRAAKCVAVIEENTRLSVPLSVVRVLLDRVPDGTVPALLRYLPFARDEEVEQEIAFGLYELSKETGNLDPALVAALGDALPERRALAACIVGRLGSKEQRAKVRRLLEDAAPLVRLRAAQGLLAAEDAAGIPALIELLNEPAVEISWQAEELLHWSAGNTAPQQTVGAASQAELRAARRAWRQWWGSHGAKVNVAATSQQHRRPLLILVCEHQRQAGNKNGRVALYGCSGIVRWVLDGERRPIDAQLLPGNRILLAEHGVSTMRGNGRQLVTERQLDGTLLRSIECLVNDCRRLPNGNTLIDGGRDEITPEGTNISLAQGGLTTADGGSKYPGRIIRRLGNGRFLCDPDQGEKWEFDSLTCAVIRRLKAEDETRLIDLLPSGHLLLRRDARFVAVGWLGKVAWQCSVADALSVASLPDRGLVAADRYPCTRLRELTQDGRTVWETFIVKEPSTIRVCLACVRLGFDHRRPASFDLDSTPELVKSLKIGRLETRRKAARFLKLEKPAGEVIGAVINGLADADQQVRGDCSEALVRAGAPAHRLLLEALSDERERVRAVAASTLARMPRLGTDALPNLICASKDKSPLVRAEAIVALSSLKTNAAEVVPVFVRALRDPDKKVGRNAANALASLKQGIDLPFDLLKALTGAPDAEVRIFAVERLSVRGITEDSARNILFDSLLTENEPRVQAAIARAIGEFGVRGKKAVPGLMNLLQESLKRPRTVDTSILQRSCALALGKIGQSNAKVVLLLAEVVNSPKCVFWVRETAIASLGQFGAAASPAMPILEKASQDENRFVKRAALQAINAIRSAR